MKQINIPNKQELVKFLDSFAKVSEAFIVNVCKDNINILASSPDNTLILYGTFACDTEFEGTLNVPDGRKLVRLLESINSDEVNLKINENNIEYKSTRVKFKYHLLDDDWLRPPSVKVDKIQALEYDTSYVLTKDTIQQVIKSSSYTPDTNKLYLSVDDGHLIGELTDKTKHNTDLYTLSLCETDQISVPVILKLDDVRIISLINDELLLKINKQYGVVLVELKTEKSTLSYIVSTLDK